LIDLVKSDAATGRGQESGDEATPGVPPATSYIEVQLCGMYDYDFGWDVCDQPAIEGSKFCAQHSTVKLCKTSGIQYLNGGNKDRYLDTINTHPVDTYEFRTKRAEFCCDRCRNLWRDTKQSREKQVEVKKLLNGERSERYTLIKNYRNSGEAVVVDKNTSRVCVTGRMLNS
jgi:hypothetical protein